MTARYTGMNPNGTGTLNDTDQLWNSVSRRQTSKSPPGGTEYHT